MSDWNQQIITEFREHHGDVETNGFGRRLVLLHTTGAKSGEQRINPVASVKQADGWWVAASAAGSTKDPAWMHNLRAHPDVELEAPADDPDGPVETHAVHAVELTGSERDDAYAEFVRMMPGFGDYVEKAGDRVIPVVHLVTR